jgi:predicted ATPase
MNMRGYSSPEAKAATERARVLIEQAEALGESLENPLMLYSVLYLAWATNFEAFNGDALCTLAAQFLALAEKQGAPFPTMLGHGLVGYSLLTTASPAPARRHYDHAIELYDPTYRPLSLLYGFDCRTTFLGLRSNALWFLGYPDAALAAANQGLKEARDIDHAGNMFQALHNAVITHFLCRNYATLEALANELFALAQEQKSTALWQPVGLIYRGWAFAGTDRASEAVQLIASGLATYQLSGATFLTSTILSSLAKTQADLGQFGDVWRFISEAKEVTQRTGERWFEVYVDCVAGEIALKLPQPDLAKAEAYFERALAVARGQQAKSWELRAATGMARLWRDQGKPQQARELLAPIYSWFTEGFDTRDLKEAKALLEELASA